MSRQKHLYFICPTDYLEPVIDATFNQENYYMTSLGNDLDLNDEFVGEINGFIETKNIKEITFVLSKDNHFSHEKGHIELQDLSSYLNEKVDKLRDQLNVWLVDDININALIYNKKKDVFVEADFDLFKLRSFRLN